MTDFASAGSRRWLQVAVNRKPHLLLGALQRCGAIAPRASVKWASPLEPEDFQEYRDLKALEKAGITIVSGIPGGANLPLYDALWRSTIRHVLARHEQGAGFIAHGMARSTGRPAVCFATSGPGATNLVTAIADAKLDSVPIIAFTCQVATTMIGSDAFQEVDTYGMTLPITKHSFLVKGARELLKVVPQGSPLP